MPQHGDATVDNTEKVLENRLRRVAYRRGERVLKLRQADGGVFTYLIVDAGYNTIIARVVDLDELERHYAPKTPRVKSEPVAPVASSPGVAPRRPVKPAASIASMTQASRDQILHRTSAAR